MRWQDGLVSRAAGDRFRALYPPEVLMPSPREAPRAWILALLWRPVDAARILRLRYRLWAAQPGDVFEDFQRNQLIVLTGVKPEYFVGVQISRELLDGWDGVQLKDTGVVLTHAFDDGSEFFSQRTLVEGGRQTVVLSPSRAPRAQAAGWALPRPDEAQRARTMLHALGWA